MATVRHAGLAAAIAAAPVALAWRFALVYRLRAGYPRPRSPRLTPADVGLPWEPLTVVAPGARLDGWFIPARNGRPGPGIALVHGWESGRDRALPFAQIFHALGLHVLAVDVRGHGSNPPETLPVTAGEFGLDAAAAFDALLARPEVTHGGIAGHSLGGVGAVLAAAADPRVRALVATATPADPWRLTRQTFRLARLPLPDAVAYPLAWLTTRIFVHPRGHAVDAINASTAIARYAGPALLLHGSADAVVPASHLGRLEAAARRARAGNPAAGTVETVLLEGGQHSWLYELPEYRRAVGGFLARALDGPLDPAKAAAVAAEVPARRLVEPEPARDGSAGVVRRSVPDALAPAPEPGYDPLGVPALETLGLEP